MPSKLRKALGAVKDQTSLSIAKASITNASNLEVIILKATRHDESLIKERYVNEILTLISSNKVYAAVCTQLLAKRIGKTKNWIVALKSLMLVLRIFQDGDPHFAKDISQAMKRGAKVLNLSSFRDDSSFSPWDYTAFVRTFALYLDVRLDCFLTGKLQRRFTNRERESDVRCRNRHDTIVGRIMEPAVMVDKLAAWQKLLDRAIATRPTGAAKNNRLIQVSLHAVVQESFDLYRDISEGLALILDNFFQLQYQSCVGAFKVCVKSVKQFDELCSFYNLCKSIGVGRTSEYPSVQKISEELIETLQEFLKDQSTFPTNGRSPPHLILHTAGESSFSTDRNENGDQCSETTTEGFSERESEPGSQCTSLEDLMGMTDVATTMDQYLEQLEKPSQGDDMVSQADSGSTTSMPLDQGTISAANSVLDLMGLDDWPSEDQEQGQYCLAAGEMGNWEIVLAEATSASHSTQASASVSPDVFDTSGLNNLFDQLGSTNYGSPVPEHGYNPFLLDTVDVQVQSGIATTRNDQLVNPSVNDLFSLAPTFHVAPTFNAQNPDQTTTLNGQDDPFAPYPSTTCGDQLGGSLSHQNLLLEQQLWMQNQDNIISKNLC